MEGDLDAVLQPGSVKGGGVIDAVLQPGSGRGWNYR